jgi:hypothetical protein
VVHPTPSSLGKCSVLPALDGNAQRQDKTRISNAVRTENQAGSRRREAAQRQEEAVEWHELTLRNLLTRKTDDKSRLGHRALLQELTEEDGLGWTEIARLVGVSVPALRKWRLGGDISPTRLGAVARLAAFLEIVASEAVHDPAAWLHIPLHRDHPYKSCSKADIYAAGGAQDLLAFAKDYIRLDDLLARWPDVGNKRPARTHVVQDGEGNLSIVPNRND